MPGLVAGEVGVNAGEVAFFRGGEDLLVAVGGGFQAAELVLKHGLAEEEFFVVRVVGTGLLANFLSFVEAVLLVEDADEQCVSFADVRFLRLGNVEAPPEPNSVRELSS